MKPTMPGYFQELLAERSGPCISIYAPTVRLGRPQGSENDRMFSGLVQRAEQELRQRYPDQKVVLVSDHDAAQDEATQNGALPGFGKQDLGSPKFEECVRQALGNWE